jgi:signal transduction histidine kinase
MAMVNRIFTYKDIFERAFNPIAIYFAEDTDSPSIENIRYVDVNPAYEQVNRINKEDLIGKTFTEIWPFVEKRWGRLLVKCVKTGKTTHCQGKSAYTKKYLEAISFPLSNNMLAAIFLDLTKWKNSDNQLKKSQAKLLEYRTKLRKLATELTVSEEKTRREISIDIHDSIGHSLLTLMLDLNKLMEDPGLSEPSRIQLKKNIALTEKMIAESRQLIFDLSPPILLEVGLAPAIESLADRMLVPQKISWKISTRGNASQYDADDNVCIILYRMTKELFANVIKHSGASFVDICINRGPHGIQVVIEDNGKGLSKKIRRDGGNTSSGLGLFSIRERLIHIGGEMQIISENGGTTISMLAPLHLNDKNSGGPE